MKVHFGGRRSLLAAVLGAAAVFAIALLVALGGRSVVAGPGSAPAAAPANPGHPYSQVDLPVGTWTGLNADLLDGAEAAGLEESAEIDTDIAAHTAIPSAHHTKTTDASEIVSGTMAPERIVGTAWTPLNDGSGSGLNADLLDGAEAAALEESAEIDTDIAAHTAIASAHHTKTTSASEIVSGTMAPERIVGTAWTPLNDGSGSGLDADLLDGQNSTAFAGASHNHDVTYWKLTGNSGTTPATNFLGTTDNQSLELRVNSSRALRLEPNATSPNVIGGYSGNAVTAGAYGAAICGGGFSLNTNRVTDNYGTVGGGGNNQAGNPSTTGGYEEPFATVGGGYSNDASGNTATIAGGYDSAASGSHATVGGGESNDASGDSATVAGGVDNAASDTNSTVAGGAGNAASGSAATVAGGISNTASALVSTVGGGYANNVSADYATIAGGGWSEPFNPATGNRVTDNYGTVGGGGNNQAGNGGVTTDRIYATVAGGKSNTASANYSTIGGGGESTPGTPATGNRATDNYGTVCGGGNNQAGDGGDATSAPYATVGGGKDNTATDDYATVGGGNSNDATGPSSTVSGGNWNGASGSYSAIGGGDTNNASGDTSTVSGGISNDASGAYSTIPGGYNNTASGAYSFAAGYTASATHSGSFVWSSAESTSSWDINTFTVRSHKGAKFYTASGTLTGVVLASGGGSWSSLSDRNQKENFTPVDGQEVLALLADMPITTWNLKSQDASIRHMGPMSQDFSAAFGLGEDERYIGTLDADGVALAAIQALHELSQEQATRIQALEEENASLQQRLDDVEARVTALEGGAPLNGGSESLLSSVTSSGWLALLGGLAVVGLVLAQRRLAGGRR